jgi:hypothetical protein
VNRAELDERNGAVIRRHWRTLQDTGGQPSPALLDDLAGVAVAYSEPGMKTAAATAFTVSSAPELPNPGRGQVTPAVTVTPPKSTRLPGAPPAPRRTAARRGK